MVIVNGYTFYNHSCRNNIIRWACTAGVKCKTNLFTAQREVIRAKLEHSHPPNKYIIRNGVYIKL